MKIQVTCLECGKSFKVSPLNYDARCPKCHGVDLEAEDFFFHSKPSSRNYSNGPFDLATEVK